MVAEIATVDPDQTACGVDNAGGHVGLVVFFLTFCCPGCRVWQLQAQHQRVDQSTTDRDGEFVSRATLHPARALAAAVVTPFVAVNIFEGTKAMDKSLIVMALTFKARRYLLLRKVYLPQLLPYIFSAFRYGFGATWKIVNSASVILRSVSASSTPRLAETL